MNQLNIDGPGRVIVGKRSRIAPDVQFIFSRAATVRIGDYCSIGPGVKFISDGGDITIGDWTSVHDRVLLLSTAGLEIGQHCWFGQHCVVDGTGNLTIGNGVRVGMYSQLWSHVAAGEQIEGCTLFGTKPVVIEDDVWLVGSCIVASGVTIGKRSVALSGSNITKSFPALSVFAGSPATLREKMRFYRDVSIEEKWQMLQDWMPDIAKQHALEVTTPNRELIVLRRDAEHTPEFMCFVLNEKTCSDELAKYPDATVCDVTTKKYNKTYSNIEALVLKSLAGNKARFYI